MSRKIINNWLSLAEYDLATAEALLQTKRYLYVAFMCQQAIEKVLKACYVKHHVATPPYTHNLLRLVAELPCKADMDARMLEFVETLNSYYLESRYTEDIEELAKVMTQEKANLLLTSTQELFEWIKAKL